MGATFSHKGGKTRVSGFNVSKPHRSAEKSVEQTLQAIREGKEVNAGGYRERSLAIHGLICAKCSREFPPQSRNLLTVHHKDGNHLNNPPDGSNWENLCVYCHEAEHSRGVLGEYLTSLKTPTPSREERVVFKDEGETLGGGSLAARLKVALEKKRQQG